MGAMSDRGGNRIEPVGRSVGSSVLGLRMWMPRKRTPPPPVHALPVPTLSSLDRLIRSSESDGVRGSDHIANLVTSSASIRSSYLISAIYLPPTKSVRSDPSMIQPARA